MNKRLLMFTKTNGAHAMTRWSRRRKRRGEEEDEEKEGEEQEKMRA